MNDFDQMTTNESKFEKVYYAKMATKKETLPHFTFKYKDESGQYVEVDKILTTLKGNLTNIETSEYTYEGNVIKTVKLYITLNTTLVILTCSYTQILRSIINSLINLDHKPREISIQLYQNKQGYNSCYFLVDGKIANWKFPADDMKKFVDTAVVGKKTVTSCDRLDEMLERELVLNVVNRFYRGSEPEVPETDEASLFASNEAGIPISEETDVDDFFAGSEPFVPPAGSNTSKTKKK